MSQKELPAKPSKAKFAQPQPPQARSLLEEMPEQTPEMCPACYAQRIVRREYATYRIGDRRVRECRGKHRWCPEDAEAVERLAKAQEKMRKRRGIIGDLNPPPVDPQKVDPPAGPQGENKGEKPPKDGEALEPVRVTRDGRDEVGAKTRAAERAAGKPAPAGALSDQLRPDRSKPTTPAP